MKSIKDIEKITIEELEAISFDDSIAVPHDLSEKIRARISRQKKKSYGIISAAAAVTIIVAGLSLSMTDNAAPKDTFDDPYLAYAELERVLATISEGVKKGMDMLEESEYVIEKSTEIFK